MASSSTASTGGSSNTPQSKHQKEKVKKATMEQDIKGLKEELKDIRGMLELNIAAQELTQASLDRVKASIERAAEETGTAELFKGDNISGYIEWSSARITELKQDIVDEKENTRITVLFEKGRFDMAQMLLRQENEKRKNLEKEKAKLQAELAEEQEKTKNQDMEMETLKTGLTEVQEKMENLEAEKTAMKAELAREDAKMKILEDEKGFLQVERDILQDERDTLQTEKDELQTEKEALQEEKNALQKEKDTFQTEKELLHAEKEGLEADLAVEKEETKELEAADGVWKKLLAKEQEKSDKRQVKIDEQAAKIKTLESTTKQRDNNGQTVSTSSDTMEATLPISIVSQLTGTFVTTIVLELFWTLLTILLNLLITYCFPGSHVTELHVTTIIYQLYGPIPFFPTSTPLNLPVPILPGLEPMFSTLPPLPAPSNLPLSLFDVGAVSLGITWLVRWCAYRRY